MAISTVLFSTDPWHHIAAFQDGVPQDMAPFVKQTTISAHDAYYEDRLLAWATALHTVLAPWYATYGHARLPYLVECLPHMRDLVLLDAIYTNDVTLLRHLHDQLDLVRGSSSRLLNVAAKRGHLEIVAYLHAMDHASCKVFGAMNLAARNGHLEVVQFLHTHREEGCDRRAMTDAAANNHLHVVEWLHVHRKEGCSSDALTLAASHGHLDMVQWLLAHRREGKPTQAMLKAIQGNHLAVMKYLEPHVPTDVKVSTVVVDALVSTGALSMLEWLHTSRHKIELTHHAMVLAARHGQLAVLQWLHDDVGVACPPGLEEVAAGHDDILDYLVCC
ncbi:Aste57867_8613 [Aphanomyces stellatus]|uniref:Aste57867_8613 protein n=1 Tax=Aphanomyces stellatus TaxID=120398 RepID=A0A485KKV3_9STRA|nr:hypothetical protein As57867_008579 [Aphanomyces stellatus]VFT85499.1 Aste57867_8613 [Aphanomyces stellatus]